MAYITDTDQIESNAITVKQKAVFCHVMDGISNYKSINTSTLPRAVKIESRIAVV
jgi:hypothetical protein